MTTTKRVGAIIAFIAAVTVPAACQCSVPADDSFTPSQPTVVNNHYYGPSGPSKVIKINPPAPPKVSLRK